MGAGLGPCSQRRLRGQGVYARGVLRALEACTGCVGPECICLYGNCTRGMSVLRGAHKVCTQDSAGGVAGCLGDKVGYVGVYVNSKSPHQHHLLETLRQRSQSQSSFTRHMLLGF